MKTAWNSGLSWTERREKRRMNGNHIVCECNGTTVAQIERAVQEGARSFEEVQEKLHIGKQCIKCKELAKLLIESFVEDMEEQ